MQSVDMGLDRVESILVKLRESSPTRYIRVVEKLLRIEAAVHELKISNMELNTKEKSKS